MIFIHKRSRLKRPRALLLIITIAFAGVLGAGCERVEFDQLRMPELPSLPPSPGSSEPVESPDDDAPRVEYDPGPSLALAAWPGRDGRHTFAMTWLGSEEPIVLREKPDPDAAVAVTIQWLDGTAIDWRDTRIVVTFPQIYRAEQPVTYTAYPYDLRDELVLDEEIELSFDTGDLLRVYGDAGEQQCYVARGDDFFIVDCAALATGLERLVPEDADGLHRPWDPVTSQWWILVVGNGKRGWWRVNDEHVEVRPVPMGD